MSFLRVPPLLLAALGVVGVAGVGAACSSSTSASPPSSCLGDPTACGSGQTCWPLDATHFSCIGSASSVTFGQSCQNTFGVATCADGMACDQSTPTDGVCTPYCSAEKLCPEGYTCTSTQAGDVDGGVVISLCRTTPGTPIGTQSGGGDAGDPVMLQPDGSFTGSDGGPVLVAN